MFSKKIFVKGKNLDQVTPIKVFFKCPMPDFQYYSSSSGNWTSRVVNFHLSSSFGVPFITKLQDKIDSSRTSPVKKLAAR